MSLDAQYLTGMQIPRRGGFACRHRKRIPRAERHCRRYQRVEAGGSEAGMQSFAGAGAHRRERVLRREVSQWFQDLRIWFEGDSQMRGDLFALLEHPFLELVGSQ